MTIHQRSHAKSMKENVLMNVSSYCMPLVSRIGLTTKTASTRPGWSVRRADPLWMQDEALTKAPAA